MLALTAALDSYSQAMKKSWLLQSSREKLWLLRPLTLTVKPWKKLALTALDSYSQALEKFGSYSPWLLQSRIGNIWLLQPFTLTVKHWKNLALTALGWLSFLPETFNFLDGYALYTMQRLIPKLKPLLKHLSRRFLGLYLFHHPAPPNKKEIISCQMLVNTKISKG